MAGTQEGSAPAAGSRPHIRGDLSVPGVLRVSRDTVCEGNLNGAAGVVLGDNVVVEGVVASDGPITLGPRCRIEGGVNVSARPGGDVAPGRPAFDASTIGAILEMMLDVTWPRARGDPAPPLAPDARDDVLDGLVVMLDRVHRPERAGSQWSADEVFAILLHNVMPLVAPIAPVVRRDEDALVRIGRPHVLPEGRASFAGWPDAVVSVVQAVGRHLYPGFRVETDEGLAWRRSADPDEVRARVRLGRATIANP